MTIRICSYLLLVFLVTVFISLTDDRSAWSAQLSFVTKEGENPDRIALVINRADKLAGMKVTITYDKERLSFIKAGKSEATSSFLHVVNDKKPGMIIVVMASAKGISGDNVVLFYMEFSKTEVKTDIKPEISVTHIQLMDENLQEISGNRPQLLF